MHAARKLSLELGLKWRSEVAWHKDRLFVGNLDLERDILPGDMAAAVSELDDGACTEHEFPAGVLVSAFEQSNIIRFDSRLLHAKIGQHRFTPYCGRFYPQAIAAEAMNCRPDNFNPFRLVEIAGETMVADRNHPLSTYPLSVEACHRRLTDAGSDPAPLTHDLASELTRGGPGMQVPYHGRPTDFYSQYPFARDNQQDDAIFYRQPRLLQHLDDVAIEQVTGLYARIIGPAMKVLDLMSSYLSHLPMLNDLEVVGLGMNQQELEQNRQLSDWLVHDLNQRPQLPFASQSFDAAICTSSIEYLVDPLAVVDEVARVLKPGAIFMLTFSDRWFPGKQIRLWSEMHPFERLGLVLDFLGQSGRFEALHSETIRGLPRPSDDVHSKQRTVSDPVFAVWGKASKGSPD